jgi:hypothetical protein
MKTFDHHQAPGIWSTSREYIKNSFLCACTRIYTEPGTRVSVSGETEIRSWGRCPTCRGIGVPPIPSSELDEGAVQNAHQAAQDGLRVDFVRYYGHRYTRDLLKGVMGR